MGELEENAAGETVAGETSEDLGQAVLPAPTRQVMVKVLIPQVRRPTVSTAAAQSQLPTTPARRVTSAADRRGTSDGVSQLLCKWSDGSMEWLNCNTVPHSVMAEYWATQFGDQAFAHGAGAATTVVANLSSETEVVVYPRNRHHDAREIPDSDDPPSSDNATGPM